MTCCKCGRPIRDDEEAHIVNVGGYQMISHTLECPRAGDVMSADSKRMIVVQTSVMVNEDGDYTIGSEDETALERWEDAGGDVSKCIAYYDIEFLVPRPSPTKVSATLPPASRSGRQITVTVG